MDQIKSVLTCAERNLILKSYNLIKGRDLSFVRNYLEVNEGRIAEETRQMEHEYKCFIALSFVGRPGRNIPISDKIDPFWHTHILFTHDYTEMCHILGGQYIHHVPAVTLEERQRLCSAYNENTLSMYEEMFGKPPVKWWPPDADICIACCDRPHHLQKRELLLTA